VLCAAPLLLYTGISVALIGRPVIGHLGSTTMGTQGDPAQFVWFLEWWPQAIANGWDPLHSHVVWAPDGYNMAWGTSIPLWSLVLAPLTALAGPIVSYNVLTLLAPAFSGWAAFLLCRAVGADYLPSVAGGYLFGFSTYLLGHASAHPNLSFVAPVPLAAYLVVRLVKGQLSGHRFVPLLTLVLAAEFLTSTEVFLTFTIMATITFGIAFIVYSDYRLKLRKALILTGLSYVITGILVSPFLYASLVDSHVVTNVDPLRLSLDPISIFIPSELTSVGGALARSISERFTANAGEIGGYIGLVLLGILAMFIWEKRRERIAVFLFAVAACAVLLAMGPRLHVFGHVTAVRLPWTPFFHLPITELVLPVRMMLYAWVPIAVATALWLSARNSWWRWGLVGLAIVTLLPNTSYIEPSKQVPFWHSDRFIPGFFRNGVAESMLGQDKNVLILPYGWAKDSNDMLWQASADMDFRMPEAYITGTIPPDFLCWTVVRYMLGDQYPRELRREFLDFLAVKEVDAVVAGNGVVRKATALLTQLGRPRRIKGVHVYRIPRDLPANVPATCA
jgi:hypothetical protein